MTRKLVARFALPLVATLAASAHAQSVVRVDGSSSVFPVTEAVAEEFQIRKRGRIRVTVGISGTRGGFRRLCRGETDVQGASRPILKEEMEACAAAGVEYFELPVAFDAVTVVVNPRNDWARSLTTAELKRIWEPAAQGRITRWSQVNPQWPDAPLVLFGPGPDSGTFDYFTEAIVGRARASRNDYFGSEDDNVLVYGIESNRHALGYIPHAYYAANTDRLEALAIDAGAGPVDPELASVLSGAYRPLSRPLFLYVSANAARRPEVRELVEFLMQRGAALVREVGYLPLDPQVYAAALRKFREGRVGSAFGGRAQIGLQVDEVTADPSSGRR